MEYDAGDILDRYSIATLKKERTDENVGEFILFRHGYNHLVQTHCRIAEAGWDELLEGMYDINRKIWDAESAIRKGQLNNNFEEAGRGAIKVRGLNIERIALKNEINAVVGSGIHDTKSDHVGEGDKNEG